MAIVSAIWRDRTHFFHRGWIIGLHLFTKALPKAFFCICSITKLSHVDPLKGKFRSFLVASVQNFLSDEADRARRKKRGGDREFVCMDAESVEERYRLEPVEYLTAETIFDARCAMTVLGEAMSRLHREYSAGEKPSTLETLEPFLDPINNRELPSYEQVAIELSD
jgi:hypothetical protein